MSYKFVVVYGTVLKSSQPQRGTLCKVVIVQIGGAFYIYPEVSHTRAAVIPLTACNPDFPEFAGIWGKSGKSSELRGIQWTQSDFLGFSG